jgi:hypothetical protein
MCARVKAVPARASQFKLQGVNILQLPAFLHVYFGYIFEAGAILQFFNIATEQSCSASVQAAYEDILVNIVVPVFHKGVLRDLCLKGVFYSW